MNRALVCVAVLSCAACHFVGLDENLAYRCVDGGCPGDLVCFEQHCVDRSSAGGGAAGGGSATGGGGGGGGATGGGAGGAVDAGPCGAACTGLTVCGGGADPHLCALDEHICSRDSWCWDNPRPTGNTLRGLWAGSSGYLWAVGATGTILGWTGSVWFKAPSPVTVDLNGIYGSAPDDVWAVGNGGTVLHFDGSSWSSVPSNTPVNLYGVFAAEDGGAWLVGDPLTALTPPTLEAYVDGGWTDVTNPMPGGARLLSIWGTSGNDFRAAGNDRLVLHFDGNTLTTEQSPSGLYLSIHGSSRGDYYLAGTYGLAQRLASVGTWDPVPGYDARFNSVHVTADGGILIGTPFARIYEVTYDGGTEVLPMQTGYFEDSWLGWAETKGQVWAVGDVGRIAARTSGVWSLKSTGDANAELEGVWSPDAVHVIAVGPNRHGARLSNGTWLFNGQVGGRTLAAAHAVTGFGPADYALVGSDNSVSGAVAQIVGGVPRWDELTPAPLYGAWASPTGELFVAGDDGVYMQSNRDAGFINLDGGFDAGLRAIGGYNYEAWVGGQGGLIAQFGGNGWVNFGVLPSQADINGVWLSGPGHPCFVGQGGTLYGPGGPIPTGTTADLFAISGTSSGELFISGANGTVLHFVDGGVVSEETGTRYALRGISIGDGGVAYVAGERSAILRRAP